MPVDIQVKTTGPDLRKIADEVAKVGLFEVHIGITSDADAGSKGTVAASAVKTDEEGRPVDTGITVAAVGAIHEFGLGDMKERSFLRSTMIAKANIIAETVDRAMKLVVDGKWTAYKAMAVVGLATETEVRLRIKRKEIVQDLADATIKSKTVRGKKGDVALVNFGQLINSIRHVVRWAGSNRKVTR